MQKSTPPLTRFTPEVITELAPNEVFVFGSNVRGNHLGGAARAAHTHFGAAWGVGEGTSGQSYALPTLNEQMQKVSREELLESLVKLIHHVHAHPQQVYYLTKVGCGIAGWDINTVRTLVWRAVYTCQPHYPTNLVMPREFHYQRKELYTDTPDGEAYIIPSMEEWKKLSPQ